MSAAPDDRFERLLTRAMVKVEGPSATETLWNLRNDRLDKYGRSLAYELVLDVEPEDAWVRFSELELAKLGAYLSTKKFGLLGGPQVLIAVWHADQMYVFEAPAFFQAVAELSEVSTEDLERRIRARQRSPSAGSFVTQLLPPPPDSSGDE